jgi:hypothetical protein
MPNVEFTDDECTALAVLLRETIAADARFPLSPRIERLKVILDKLDPPLPAMPSPPPTDDPSTRQANDSG